MEQVEARQNSREYLRKDYVMQMKNPHKKQGSWGIDTRL